MYGLQEALTEAQQTIARLEKALEFYATRQHILLGEMDGYTANQALQLEGDENNDK